MKLGDRWPVGMIVFVLSCSHPILGLGADVSLTADVTTVAEGGTVHFTVTVTPGDHVEKVTLTYEGLAGSDEDTSAPYVIGKQFDTAADDLTVTATVTYDNEDPPDQDTLDIDVVGLTIYGAASPVRASTQSYYAYSNPWGKTITSFSWTYTPTTGEAVTWTDNSPSNNTSLWSGTMVVSGTLKVEATVCGVLCTRQQAVAVAARTGASWSIEITCAQDNESGWGDRLTTSQPVTFGENRDRDSNDRPRIIVPQPTDGNFSDGFTLSRVTDGGPCNGFYYVLSNTLKIQRETVINRYIKAGGPPPEDGADNWHSYMDARWNSGDADDFVQAVSNHEYRGTPATEQSTEGHQGRIEKSVDDRSDPLADIEAMVDQDQTDLTIAVNAKLETHDDAIYSFFEDGDWASVDGPNWGGTGSLGAGKHARYDMSTQSYSGLTYGPEKF